MAENPYAFPSPEEMSGEYGAYTVQHPGMSLRDWFAGQIINGMLAYNNGGMSHDNVLAETAYRTADSMLAERAKEPR